MELTASVYGVEFYPVGRIRYYADNGEDIRRGDLVLVMGDFGLEVARVVAEKREMSIDQLGYELKAIVRKLTEEDLEVHRRNEEDAKEAKKIFREIARKMELPMKPVLAKYTFDRSKLIFFFSSEERVDFREFVKELAKIFKTRIELKQLGVRDEMKLMGGLGLCGRPACCTVFLREFQSVTLKHAKKQQMMINPAKISGTCRRLLCCLTFEHEFYEEALKGVPDEGSTVEYEGKRCKVVNVNVFLDEITLMCEDRKIVKVELRYFKYAQNVQR